MVKARSKYKPKRRFHGNRHTRQNFLSNLSATEEATVDFDVESNTSSSGRKSENAVCQAQKQQTEQPLDETNLNDITTLQSSPTSTQASFLSISHSKLFDQSCSSSSTLLVNNNSSSSSITGYRLFDMEVLNSIINSLVCPECKQNHVSMREMEKRKAGVVSCICIYCPCGFEKVHYTSKKCENGKGYDANKRIVYSMRSCGQGYSGLKKFNFLMNMPKPMNKNAYMKLITRLKSACEKTAQQTMAYAASELKKDKETVSDIPVSCDGSWQRRGFSSLNGFVSSISMDNGKVIDVAPMSRYCRACVSHEKDKTTNPQLYESWKAGHTNCKSNYKGSAPNMEVIGAVKVFERSIERHGLRYTELYSDGDSKTFPAIENIYGDKKVVKKECVGHVQKRVGNRLRNLKKKVHGLGGKGKLTESIIDRLQNYYGIAIRSNKGDLTGMKNAIYACLFHVASSEDRNLHTYCPEGANSWCRYKRDIANGTNLYKSGPGLPLTVIKHVKPIMADLSADSLLSRCLDGKTQNQNECFNNYVWRRLPKDTYTGLEQFEFGIYDAVGVFNVGRKATIMTYQNLSLAVGKYTLEGCDQQNKERLYNAEYKNKVSSKTTRKIIRGKKKKKDDKKHEKEGKTYESGAF